MLKFHLALTAKTSSKHPFLLQTLG